VDPEHRHGDRRRLSVPAGRELSTFVLRARVAVALAALFSAAAGLLHPASAGEPQLDPAVASVMDACTPPGPAPRAIATLPPAWTFDPKHIVFMSDRDGPPSTDQAEPSPAPSTAAPATAAPTAGPTYPPPLQPPPAGPGVLLPPTPRPTGTPQVTPPPLPTSEPAGSPGPVLLVRPSGPPSIAPAGSGATAAPEPVAEGATPIPTLRPFDLVVMADSVHGFNRDRTPGEATGNVHIFYIEGQIVGDKAVYDGDHTVTITGHTYLLNREQDSILYADQIEFDTRTHKATLANGRGESVAGVQHGKIHYSAEKMTSLSNGVTHGDHGSFTTCENPHGGYHVEANTIDVTPGDKLVARKAVVFLGPLAIFYLPFLVIPLREVKDPRRPTTFLPVIGYSQIDGYYIKVRLGFAPSDTYYGYYRIDYYTKRGLGIGYSAVIGTKNKRRYVTIDAYTISDHVDNARETNVNVQEQENFSNRLRGQFGVNYQGDFGSGVSLPPSFNLTATLTRSGNNVSETLSVSDYKQGSLQDSFNLGFVDNFRISPAIQQLINITLNHSSNSVSTSGSLELNTDTHIYGKIADFDLVYDKTNYSSNPFGYNRVPELQVDPHIDWHGFQFAPQMQLTVGEYSEPENDFSTSRGEFVLNEPVALKIGASDLNATWNVRQDYYGTGDEKAFETQDLSFSTPFADHFVNSVTYNEQHPIGPATVPFETLDQLSGGSKSLQDVLRIFNSSIYTLALSTGTNFDAMAQPITYQLNARISPRSLLVLGGFWSPGPGNGFDTTNVQVLTPFGRDTTLQFSTNVNWKNKGALQNKNVYLSKIIGDCYRLDLTYNEDFKQLNFNVTILAFPGQGLPIGFNSPSQILPQSFGGL
jgi:hypothetical protein